MSGQGRLGGTRGGSGPGGDGVNGVGFCRIPAPFVGLESLHGACTSGFAGADLISPIEQCGTG